jgi:hypothetical protein
VGLEPATYGLQSCLGAFREVRRSTRVVDSPRDCGGNGSSEFREVHRRWGHLWGQLNRTSLAVAEVAVGQGGDAADFDHSLPVTRRVKEERLAEESSTSRPPVLPGPTLPYPAMPYPAMPYPAMPYRAKPWPIAYHVRAAYANSSASKVGLAMVQRLQISALQPVRTY